MTSLTTSSLSEIEVVKLWQEYVQNHKLLDDSEGRQVEIVYPGRPNDDRGGDYRDAVIFSGDQCRQGNIEIHTRASGWQEHGHHRDPVYNQVVLHVALVQGRPGKTILENGQSIPTIILNNHPLDASEIFDSKRCIPCYGFGSKSENPGAFLDEAGDRRFSTKVARFRGELSQLESGQSLYQGTMEALGYTKNKAPFIELAHKMPLSFIEETVSQHPGEEDSLVWLQALLLGSAGLLPSQRSIFPPEDKWVTRFEQIWAGSDSGLPMSSHNWELYKVRPGNLPVRRIAAMSHLLFRFRRKGYLDSLLNLIRAAPDRRAYRGLELAFLAVDEGYWKNHYDFGPPDSAVIPVLLGRERSAEIIINVLLPFALAWSERSDEKSLACKVRCLYNLYPRLESNSIERHMLDQLSLSPSQVNSARRQQGLIYIYKTFCTEGKCRECFLIRGLAGTKSKVKG